jgi:anti-sigma regulatory factor (Ser/Thr protein kinase)
VRTPTDTRGQEIRQFILARVDEHPHDIARLTAKQFGLTRQAVNLHLQRLLADSDLVRQGKTRRTRFFLAPKKTWQKHYAGRQSESDVWESAVLPQISDLPDNALDIWRYSFTEMFNNAVDHSSGTRITVQLKCTAVNVEIAIIDNGVGIFKKIQRAMKFSNERYSPLELAKGKFTTDPAHHTGEGIFFTSKMLDAFDISSGGVYFTSVSPLKNPKGTAVWMKRLCIQQNNRACKNGGAKPERLDFSVAGEAPFAAHRPIPNGGPRFPKGQSNWASVCRRNFPCFRA